MVAVVNPKHHLKLYTKATLYGFNAKFELSLRFIEQVLRDMNKSMEDCTLEELDVL